MNIFDQYGIKEVADVVLYDIELDKYDNEVYIPLMYFDTLKVSTVEQSAESTSARGGLGNPELIAWDFGKEITVNLEDALYTPASQSLMWGGKFGVKKTKIYGVWNPYVYETDAYGRPVYVKRTEIPEIEVVDSNVIFHLVVNGKPMHFEAPLRYENDEVEHYPAQLMPTNKVNDEFVWFEFHDGNTVYQYTLVQAGEEYFIEMSFPQESVYTPVPDGDYPAIEVDYDFIYFTCPCDGGAKWYKIEPAEGHYKYYRAETAGGDWGEGHWQEDQLEPTEYRCPSDNPVQESEEIDRIVEKYAVQENLTADVIWQDNALPERAHIGIEAFGNFEFHAYEFLTEENVELDTTVCYYSDIDMCESGGDVVKCSSEKIDAYGYIWKDSDIKMISLEGEQDAYFISGTDLRYRIRTDNRLQELAIEYTSDHEEGYYAKLNIYKNVSFKTVNENGLEDVKTVKILAGTFYIIDDWNQNASAPQDNIYEIDNGLENVYYLERMEAVPAKNTFAIDTDKNIICNNRRYMRDYDNTELTVFYNPKTMKPYEPNASSFLRQNGQLLEGNFAIIKQGELYYKWTRSKAPDYASLGYQVVVSAENFPGTYRIVGETYARARKDGQDQRFQFEIPLCKMLSSNNLTLEAAGDPTTFSMQFKVLRRDDGAMMKITQYDVIADELTGSTKVASSDLLYDDHNNMIIEPSEGTTIIERWGEYRATKQNVGVSVVSPTDESIIFIDGDVEAPFAGQWSYIYQMAAQDLAEHITTTQIPLGDDTSETIATETLDITVAEIPSNQLVVKKQTKYTVDRLFETVEVYPDGREVVKEQSWIYQKDIEAVHYLNPDEYEFDVHGNITLV